MQYLSFKIPNIHNKKTTSFGRFNYISTLKIYPQLDYLYSRSIFSVMAPDGNNGRNGNLWWHREIFMTYRQTLQQNKKKPHWERSKVPSSGKINDQEDIIADRIFQRRVGWYGHTVYLIHAAKYVWIPFVNASQQRRSLTFWLHLQLNHKKYYININLEQITRTSASCDFEISTRVFAAGWTTSKRLIIVAPSLEIVAFPTQRSRRK